MTVSVFDLFRIGVGPSSSHTVGPMRAGLRFARLLRDRRIAALAAPVDDTAPVGTLIDGAITRPIGVTVILYGSLAATGAGHGTLGACLLGLDGTDPATANPDAMESRLREIRATRTIHLAGDPDLPVTCGFEDIILRPTVVRTVHTNAVTFSAMDADGTVFAETYYSTGGGFIRTAEETVGADGLDGATSFSSATELQDRAEALGGLSAAQRACERTARSDREIDAGLDAIVQAMDACAERGMGTDGVLPGGLLVRRRAHRWYTQLAQEDPGCTAEFSEDWVNLVALAVNEENAGGGRVVTAPTNGAAGIIPAVLFYARTWTRAGRADQRDAWRRFLLAAGAVGSLYKERASISGAEVGCQGEVGSAASMAAAGLAEVLGGTPAQVCNAAEIAMEHSLGLTCDPIAGLVQVPCIERNAISAGKAINAAKMAMRGDGSHRVSLDEVIETMRRTGADMSDRYKETAGGGLATTVAVNVPEC
ncbi:L-serine ammonia-lyase [Corynebacterium terpenotabidum]|uniref:L-serine dehydratase n=1 Tax=Corynebacterium terpenotabidum Y-11 TaxID=1200352 RepID=S4XFD0_9CORY|nr:L-serine ammonia-lyase [Corynebacterium terpenotabidum]AGP31284.1 L-serine dehydratase [Corynebacterium terpenotabidum Y-11]